MKKNLITFLFYSLVLLLLLSACSGAEDRKQKYFDRGMELYEQGNYVKARLEFKNVLQIDPKDVQAYYMSAQIEEQEENWGKAYALYLRTVELDPKHVQAQIRLGRLYALSGKPEKALEAADLALAIEPTDSTALALKGLARLRMGEKASAISELEAALKVDPGNLDALSLLAALYADQGRMDRAIELAKQGLKQHPDRMGSHLLLAGLYEKSGNSEGALEILKRIIQLQPTELGHRTRLASDYHAKHQPSEARKVLELAVKELPQNPDAKLALIELLGKQGNQDQAETLLKEYVAKSPETFKLKMALASLYTQTERNSEAKTLLQAMIAKADNTDDGLKARIALAKLLLSEKSEDQALALVEESLKINPKEGEALLIRAAIALNNNDPAASIADLRSLLKENPSSVKAYRLKARVHIKKNEIALARQSLEEAIRVRPQEAAANYELADLLVKTGKIDDAIVVYEKMQRFAPDNMTVLNSLAKLYAKQNNWGQVNKVAEEMLAKHSDNPLGYLYSGMALQGSDRHAEAIAAFEHALTLKPNAAEPLISLAKSQLAIGQPEVAMQRVESVITENPENFLALNLKGEILLSQKQYEQAESVFNRVIDIQPKWDVPYLNLLKIHLIAGDETQVTAAMKAGFEHSQSLQLGLGLGSRYEQHGDYEAASEIYEKLLEQRPGFNVAANNLAMLLLRDEPDQATLDRALNLVKDFELSDNPYYLDTLGWTYFKRGEFDRALPVFERAAHAVSDKPVFDYHLALTYHRLGRLEDARKRLQAAIASDKEFAEREEVKALLNEWQ